MSVVGTQRQAIRLSRTTSIMHAVGTRGTLSSFAERASSSEARASSSDARVSSEICFRKS